MDCFSLDITAIAFSAIAVLLSGYRIHARDTLGGDRLGKSASVRFPPDILLQQPQTGFYPV